MTLHLVAMQKSPHGMAAGNPKGTKANFFNPAQARVGESVLSVLAATTTPSANAKRANYGTAPAKQQGRARAEGSSARAASIMF